MAVDMGDEIRLDSALVLDVLENLLQSVRRQILRLRLNAVQLDDVVVGLLGTVHGDRRDASVVLDDNCRPLSLSRPDPRRLLGAHRVENVDLMNTQARMNHRPPRDRMNTQARC